MKNSLQEKFNMEIAKTLQTNLGIKNINAVPALVKIVVNMGVKDALADKSNIEKAAVLMGQITGQKAKVMTAKKAIAAFKLREGDKVALMVTLRGRECMISIKN